MGPPRRRRRPQPRRYVTTLATKLNKASRAAMGCVCYPRRRPHSGQRGTCFFFNDTAKLLAGFVAADEDALERAPESALLFWRLFGGPRLRRRGARRLPPRPAP